MRLFRDADATKSWYKLVISIAAIVLVLNDSAIEDGLAEDPSQSDPVTGKIAPPFAWNRTDRYEPPDFDRFFPDDLEAGKQLDRMLEGKTEVTDVDARLALIRRGLRNTSHHRTTLLGSVGNSFVWNKEEQDPRAIELLYHASDSPDGEVSHYALYHGPTVVSGRTPNLIRMLMRKYPSLDAEIQGRIAWGMKTYGDKEQTRKLLLDLLDDHTNLDANTIGAALETYRAVFESDPPDLDRFGKLGKWVVAFHRVDVSAAHPRAASILRADLEKSLSGQPDRLIDFVTRVDDKRETGVALVQGVKARDDIIAFFKSRLNGRIDFAEMLSPRLLQEKRLREFAPHLLGGLPAFAAPSYSRPPELAAYGHLGDSGVEAVFEAFFPDDVEAGRKLDAVYANRSSIGLTDRELLDLFRRGVRRSANTPNTMLGWIVGALGWPQDPLLTEILFQAMDTKAPFEFRSAGIYYGFGLGKVKTKSILLQMFRVYMAPPFDRTTNGNMRSRILWGVRDHEDDKHYLATLFAEALRNHSTLSDEALQQADLAYRQLTDSEPPLAGSYASRGVYLVLFRDPSSKSVAELRVGVERRLGDSPHLIEMKFLDDKHEPMVAAAVRGMAGQKWIIGKLGEDPELPIVFGDLLTRDLLDRVDGDALRDFEGLLPATP
jgi:hypothetical protein